MIEPIRHPFGGKLDSEQANYMDLRDEALLWRATQLAVESAFRFGQDLPVGAVAALGSLISGRYYASDKRFGPQYSRLHAEVMADLDSKIGVIKEPDTIVVTIEPCNHCQEYLAKQPGITRVGFGLTREDVATRGLVKSHDETIFDRVKKYGYPFEAVLIDNTDLRVAGGTILDFTRRDIRTGQVQVDTAGLAVVLQDLSAA